MKSLDSLVMLLMKHGAARVLAKRLAANDNSKNQIYLGGGFGALHIIPHGKITADNSARGGGVTERDKAQVDFSWVTPAGAFPAPNAKLILYPKYPEVRMSGLLQGATNAPSTLVNSRDEGRALFLGICPDGRVLGYLCSRLDPVSQELRALPDLMKTGVFVDLSHLSADETDARSAIIARLSAIRDKCWIRSKKMSSDGRVLPYRAQNGGGYTLEAEFGVAPNAVAGPDFMGWEIKQFGVSDFVKYRAKSPVTLMTPAPTGGSYRDDGAEAFLRRFGYRDKNGRADRINFGGVYRVDGKCNANTGLSLTVTGFNPEKKTIENLDGVLALVTSDQHMAASWDFRSMLSHWNRKHAHAVYVPSMRRPPIPEYRYGAKIEMFEDTDFILFLSAVAKGDVYYDPGLKLEHAATTRPKIKTRHQFRIKHDKLKCLYNSGGTQQLI